MSEIDDFLKGAPAYKPGSSSTQAKPRASEVDEFLKDAPAQDRGLKGWAQDIGATAVKGAIGVPESLVGLADIATGGQIGKALENEGGAFGFRPKQAKEIANQWHSDATKDAQRKFQEADGIGGKLQAAIENPSVIAKTVGESLPSMFAGGALAKGVGLAAPVLAGRAGLAAAGEGAMMAGSQAESIRQQTDDGLLTGKQAALSAGTGFVGGAIGALGARAGKALGVGDVDTMIANGAQGVAREGMGVASRVGRGALAEGALEELPQSLAETALGNIALDKPVTEGMDEAAVLGTLSGGLMGGAAGALSRPAPLAAAGGAAQSAGAQAFAAGQPMTPPADLKSVADKAQWVRDWQEAAAASMTTSPGAAAQDGVAAVTGDVLPEVPGGMDAVHRTHDPRAGQRPPLATMSADVGGNGMDFEPSPEFDRNIRTFEQLKESEPTKGIGYNPLAGTPTVYKDGSVALNGDQEFQYRTGAVAPQKRSEQMGLSPSTGPMSAAAAMAVDTGAADQVQQQAALTQAAEAAAKAPKGKAPAADPATGRASPAKRVAHRVTGTLNGQPFTTMVMASTPDEAIASATQLSPGMTPTTAEPVSEAVRKERSAKPATQPATQPTTTGETTLEPQAAEPIQTGAKEPQAQPATEGLTNAIPQEVAAETTADAGTVTASEAGRTGVPGVNEQGAVPALSNVQDAPQGAAGAQTATEAVEAPSPAAGNAADAGGVPAAGDGAGVQQGGVDDLGPNTFAGSIKREIEARAEMAAKDERRASQRKPAAQAKDAPAQVDSEIYRATPDGAGKFTLESDESTIAGNGDATPRKFASEADALAWAKENGFKTAAPGAGNVQADGVGADDQIAVAANQAATSPLNNLPEPSDAQKAAGNYKVGRTRISGMEVSIENPKGSKRRSKADDPNLWEVDMPAHYGYIRGTMGSDGDHVDLFIGDGGDNGRFWVINQTTPDGKKHDEHKVITGVNSADEAVALYKASFADGFGDKVFGSVTAEMDADSLKAKLPEMEKPKPVSSQDAAQSSTPKKPLGVMAKLEEQRAKSKPKPEKQPEAAPAVAPEKSETSTTPTQAPVTTRVPSDLTTQPETDETPAVEKPQAQEQVASAGVLGAKFSTVPEQPSNSVSVERTQEIANSIYDDLGIGAESRAQSFGNPVEAGFGRIPAGVVPTGGTSNGKVYLFAENMADELAVFRTVFHELFHLGLSKTVSQGSYIQTMLGFLSDPLVRQYATRWKQTADGVSRKGTMPVNNWQALAVEEALSDIAEEMNADRGGVGTKYGAWASRMASRMASLADRAGLKVVAERIRALTRTEAEQFVQDVMRRAGDDVQPSLRGKRFRQEDEANYGTKRRGEASQVDRAVMDMAGEGREANEILRLIADASKSPYNRQVARLLRRTGANPAVSLGGDMGGGEGFKFLAKYSRKNHEVTLSEGAADRAERIFLHETTHAATLMALDRGGEYADQMNRLYESVKRQGGAAGQYGMKNVGEFVAEAFTNPEFQQALKGMKAPGGSLWSRFVAMVRRALGMADQSQDALSAALELGAKVMRENMTLRAAKSFRAEDAPAFAGVDQTETEAFRKWFGDSKAVDAQGKPLVVYHGAPDLRFLKEDGTFKSQKDRLGFGRKDGAHWFTPSLATAKSYADPRRAFDYQNAEEGTVSTYLKMDNPLIVDGGGQNWRDAQKRGKTSDVIEEARAAWHDGVIIRNVKDDYNNTQRTKATDTYVVFDSKQIKSATGNNGNFDPNDPDISHFGISDAVDQIKQFDVKEAPKNTWAHYRGMAMQALGRRQIVDLYADELPQLKQYDYLVQQMDAEKNDTGAEADKLAQDWGKLKNGEDRKLAELMHDATLAQMDPDKPQPAGMSTTQYSVLKARFGNLTPEAQALYRGARDMYMDHYKAVQQAIKDRIERSEMSEGQKRKLMADLDDKLFKELKGVYFPLARFGQYVIVVKDANGEVKNVTRAETVSEADQARKELQKAFPTHMGNTVGKVLKQAEFNAGRDAVGKGFMADLMGALDEKGVDDELRDTVAQLYLSSLPDLSWAKHGIHRKGTPGFSQDARRAFAQNMFHGARYLAKLRYSDQLQDELTAMQDHIKAYEGVEEYDSIAAQQAADEMVKRHELMMNPKSSPVSTALTSLGFVFHLGLSPASAMVNLTQTALVAYPVMGAKWTYAKAGTALLKASQEVVKAKNDLGSSLKGDELAAFNRAVKDGTIDVTMAHDLAGISQGEDQKVFWKIRPVMRAASFMFHHAEKFNRQATFIAAYRL
jgi:pimeloyl-ACP methyl ester carboxylesterase